MLCTTCKSNDFYEDEQGGLICQVCGTAAQDYIQDDNDAQDELAFYSQNIQFRSKTPKAKAKPININKPKAPQNNQIEWILKAYQFCLIKMLKTILDLSNIKSIKSQKIFLDEAKKLWIKYLVKVNHSHGQFGNYIYQNDSSRFSKDSKVSGSFDSSLMFPSSNLLLGILYYLLRFFRFYIPPQTIVRWCDNGDLPYHKLWDILPGPVKSNISVSLKSLFLTKYSSDSLHPLSLLTYSSKFCEFLELGDFPPLNAPMVARYMIASIGLPEYVWYNYVRISKILEPNQPLYGFESVGEGYIENICAMILIASKMCKNVGLWSYIQSCNTTLQYDWLSNPSNDIFQNMFSPSTIDDLDRLPRLLLLPYLRHVSKFLNPLSGHSQADKISHSYDISKFVCKFMQSLDLDTIFDSEMLLIEEFMEANNISMQPYFDEAILSVSEYTSPNNIKNDSTERLLYLKSELFDCHESYSFDINPNICEYWSNHHFIESSIYDDKKYLRILQGLSYNDINSSIKKKINNQFNGEVYVSYRNYCADKSGICHPWYIVLCERISKSCFSKSSIIHHIVDQVLEEQIHVSLCGDNRRYNKTKNLYSDLNNSNSHKDVQKLLENIVVAQVKRKQTSRLPKLHRLKNVRKKLIKKSVAMNDNKDRAYYHYALRAAMELGLMLDSENNGPIVNSKKHLKKSLMHKYAWMYPHPDQVFPFVDTLYSTKTNKLNDLEMNEGNGDDISDGLDDVIETADNIPHEEDDEYTKAFMQSISDTDSSSNSSIDIDRDDSEGFESDNQYVESTSTGEDDESDNGNIDQNSSTLETNPAGTERDFVPVKRSTSTMSTLSGSSRLSLVASEHSSHRLRHYIMQQRMREQPQTRSSVSSRPVNRPL